MQISLNLGGFKKAVTELGAVAAIVVPAIDQVPMSAGVRTALMAIGGVILAISHALTARTVTATVPPGHATPNGLKWAAVESTPAGPPAIPG